MSKPSDTPITDRHCVGSIVAASKMRELERAANEMREHIENTPCWTDAALRLKRKVTHRFDSLKKKL